MNPMTYRPAVANDRRGGKWMVLLIATVGVVAAAAGGCRNGFPQGCLGGSCGPAGAYSENSSYPSTYREFDSPGHSYSASPPPRSTAPPAGSSTR